MSRKRNLLCTGFVGIGALTLAACSPSDGDNEITDRAEVRGVITASHSTEVDGDVNELLAVLASNQSFATAQSLPNPVTIGGYVNEPFGGAPRGRSSQAGDRRDLFRVTAAPDQVISLSIADARSDSSVAGSVDNDLELYLLDGACSDADPQCVTNCAKSPAGAMIIASSTADGNNTEQITVPAFGSYFVEVCVASGASNYVLSLVESLGAAGGFEAAADFVPGEVIVRFRESAERAAGGGSGIMAARVGLQVKAGGTGRALLLDIGVGDKRLSAMRRLGVTEETLRQVARAANAATADKRDTLAVVQALRARSDVMYADLNYYRHPFAIPSDDSYPLQWHYPLINLPRAWDIETGKAPVTVAVIDTGVLINHPDLQDGRLSNNGFDFISNAVIANDGDGIDSNPDDPGDGGGAVASSFHGTHIAGTVGARTNDGDAPSVAGVTWGGVQILPLRVLGVGGGTSFDIMQAVLYAAGLANDATGDIGEARADVINLSLGGAGFSAAEEAVYLSARNDRNVIAVAAAGNSGNSTISYPAGYNGVVSVSALRLNKTLAPYSQFGSTIDIAAPGGDLSQDLNNDGFGDGIASTSGAESGNNIDFIHVFNQGTSMAAPHVAGVAALMRSVNPDLSPADFDGLLTSGALTEDLAGNGPAVRDNNFGYGMIDAAQAVVAAGGGLQPSLSLSPDAMHFGTSSSIATLDVQLLGGATLVAGVSASTNEGGDWLSVQPPAGGDLSVGAYQVSVDRSGLGNGVYSGQIVVDSDAEPGAVTVPVTIQVSDAAEHGDTGHQFVLLLDATLNPPAAVAQMDLGADNGEYAFRFENVPAGDYIVVSGSDNDFDGFVCDAGESCGVFPETGTVRIGEDDIDRMDFVASYASPATNGVVADHIGREGFRKISAATTAE